MKTKYDRKPISRSETRRYFETREVNYPDNFVEAASWVLENPWEPTALLTAVERFNLDSEQYGSLGREVKHVRDAFNRRKRALSKLFY